MENRLEISLLGGISIKQTGQSLIHLTPRKVEVLLIYLVCTGRPHTREAVAELLWPERAKAQAGHNLRTSLSRLRRVLDDYIVSADHTLAFNQAQPYRLDVAELERSLATTHPQTPLTDNEAAALVETLALYQGDFLAGFHLSNALEFEAWATLERERLHYLALEGLHRLIAYSLATATYQAGLAQARRLLALDEFDEAGHGQMMRLLTLNGQRGAALSHYDSYKRSLAAETGLEPDAEIRLLYEQIKRGELSRGAISSPPPPCPPAALSLPRSLCLYRGRCPLLFWKGDLYGSSPPGRLPASPGRRDRSLRQRQILRRVSRVITPVAKG
jgi:DNA-binding SARP family transcriptional activator